jgi:hypothetical protein
MSGAGVLGVVEKFRRSDVRMGRPLQGRPTGLLCSFYVRSSFAL